MAVAAMAACAVINLNGLWEQEARRELIGHVSLFLAPMVLLPFLMIWFLAVLPAESRWWVLPGSVPTTMLIAMGALASLLIGAYGLGAFRSLRLFHRSAAAALLCAVALSLSAGGELLREASGTPYSMIRIFEKASLDQAVYEPFRESGAFGGGQSPVSGESREEP
jgi:hypothetical protein